MNNPVTLCAVLFVAACHLAKAYDFQDSDFNQLLSSDFQDSLDSLDNVLVVHRAKRDEAEVETADDKCKKRGRRPNRLCCADESADALHEKEKEIFRGCFKEVTGFEKPDKREHGHHKKFDLFSCEEVEKRKSDMICIEQCVGQKKGLVDDEGALKADQITTYIKESYAKESWIESAADKIVSNCLAEAKNATENPSKFYTAGLKVCNPAGISLKHCIFKEIQLSCPADQINDKAACDKFQDRIKKGMDVYGPPPPPFDGPKDE